MKLTRKLQARGDGNRNTRVWRLQKESCGSSYSVMIFLFENRNPPTDSTAPVLPVPSPPPPVAAACYFPSSSIKNSTKLTHISTKTVVVLHPLTRLFLLSLCLSLSCIATINLYFVFVCVRRACVCLRCLAVVCRCVECAREPKRKEEKTQREREEVYGD
jgi:hypothetical protein